jgi:ketosteroid isomerase-like protein
MKRALLATVFLFSCATTHSSSEADVRAAMSGFMSALNAVDLDAMSSYFADNITAFVPATRADRADGKAAVVEIFRSFVTQQKTPTHLVPEDLRVDVVGDAAIVTFQIRNPAVTSRRTFIWRRYGDRWLIAHFHASNFRPPA